MMKSVLHVVVSVTTLIGVYISVRADVSADHPPPGQLAMHTYHYHLPSFRTSHFVVR